MTVEKQSELPRPLLQAFAPLHRVAMGVAWGVTLGGVIFLMTVILLLKGGDVVGPNLSLLGQFLFGFDVSWRGAFMGFLWGFVSGFILGWGFAFMRNLVFWIWLSLVRSRAEMEQFGDFLDHM